MPLYWLCYRHNNSISVVIEPGAERGWPVLRWVSKKSNFESARQRASAQSMRASVQVTAPGAITSMIAAMSTRPNRQNRGTCSRMSEPLVQKQKLRLVNRINARRGHRPRHDRYDGQRHPDGKYEPSWFRCHLFPS